MATRAQTYYSYYRCSICMKSKFCEHDLLKAPDTDICDYCYEIDSESCGESEDSYFYNDSDSES